METKNVLKRKLLFLYPNLDVSSDDKSKEQIEDIAICLKLITDDANQKVARIMSSDAFSNAKYVPSVEIVPISKEQNAFIKNGLTDLRLCVIEADDLNFDEYYQQLLTPDQQKSSDISHLLGIKLSTKEKKTKWKVSESTTYSACIETTLNGLVDVITSIILDIALYHYFKLPRDWNYRNKFSENKVSYIQATVAQKEIRRLYGLSVEEVSKIKYLPISTRFLYGIYDNEREIEKLVTAFTAFYYDYVIDELRLNGLGEKVVHQKIKCAEDIAAEKRKQILLQSEEINDIAERTKEMLCENVEQSIVLAWCESQTFSENGRKSRYLLDDNLDPETYLNLDTPYSLFLVKYGDIEVEEAE